MKRKFKIYLFSVLFIIFSITAYAVLLDNDVEVQPKSELTYYLDVSYDGIDVDGIKSSDSVTAEINSEVIYVEDKIPEGLSFEGFITSSDGKFGAVKRSDNSSCPGSVIDDTNELELNNTTCNSNGDCYYHGLHYTKNDNTVRFKVKNLKAGCKLTVGIKTKTPTIDDPNTVEVETRRDFYNTASATEGPLTVMSNMVHVYMGTADSTLYKVRYEYTGTIPEGVPSLQSETSYAQKSTISVASNPNLEGYIFSGWSSDDVTITNGKFVMPGKDVTLKGSFTEKEKYKVKYQIEGTTPVDYIVPNEKEYYDGQLVKIDSMKVGDIFNGYKFLGWTTNDVSINDNEFTMPNKNVTITGKFELIKYKVEYKYYSSILPPNSELYLPKTKMYAPGETIKLEKVNNPEDYEFMGWYHEDNFTMPEADITIYGEWKRVIGKFSPQISQKIVDEKIIYKNKNEIIFKITVKNTAGYDLTNVTLVEKLDDCVFISGKGYTLKDESNVVISKIPANSESYVYAKFIAGNDTYKKYTNVVELTSATGKEYSELDTSKEYISKKSFIVSNPLVKNKTYTLKIVKVDENNKEIDGSKFSLYSDSAETDEISTGLSFDKLVSGKTYYLKETIVPEGYSGLNKTLKVVVDNNGIIEIEGYTVSNNNSVGTVRISNKKINENLIPEPTPELTPEPEPGKNIINPETSEPEPTSNYKKEIKKKESPQIPKILGYVIPPTGIAFFFIILILKKKKRTVMLYVPGTSIEDLLSDLKEIDYETVDNEKVKVVVLAGGNEVGEKQYTETKIYELTDDGYKLIRKQPDPMKQTELLNDYVEFTKEKYKAKKYDLLFINHKMNSSIPEEIVSIEEINNALKDIKFEIILFRVGDNTSLATDLLKYADVVATPNVDYNIYSVKEFIKRINYINHKDKGEDIGNKYKKDIENFVVIAKK